MVRMKDEHVVSGAGGSPLDSLVEQLWRAPVASGDVRVVVNPGPSGAWRDVERYWVLPSLAHPRLLIPRGEPAVTTAALQSYRRLRPWKVNAARLGLSVAAACRLPVSTAKLSVQRRTPPDAVAALPLDAVPALPLAAVADTLGPEQLATAIGIRLGDNRKPTLQLFDRASRPAGYAKLAWNAPSRGCIQNERDVLADLAGGSAHMRVPMLAGSGEWDGYPYLISMPLPADVEAVRGRVARPTPEELYSLCGVYRHGALAGTGHFMALACRLGGLVDITMVDLAGAARAVERLLRERNAVVPVAVRWHGDMVPWNMAREPSGTLWCWDWESSEPDAVAGLDAWHWAVSVRRERRGSFAAQDWAAAAGDVRPYLEAAAVPRDAWPDVAAVYALVVAERAWTLAEAHGSWASSWLSPADLAGLLTRIAGELAAAPRPRASGLAARPD